MLRMDLKLRDRLGAFLGRMEGLLRRKAAEAAEEIPAVERPEPLDEAEQALHDAMGWTEDEAEDAAAVVGRKFREAIER